MVEITDPQLLAALKLGGIEDLDRGPVAEPSISRPGYSITRYFYGGKFNFAHLRYYPGSAGQPGYVYWEDGPDLTGDHTPFDHTWLVATTRGDSAMRNLLTQLGVSLPGASANSSAQSAATVRQPARAAQPSGARVNQPAQAAQSSGTTVIESVLPSSATVSDSAAQPARPVPTPAPFRPEYLVILAASLALGGMLVARARPDRR